MATQQKHWTAEELDNKIVITKPMSESDEDRIYKKLIKARIGLVIGFPFFGFLAAHLKFCCDYSISTAATDGEGFYYNPYYIDALETPCTAFVIVHELMHCALQHMTRRNSREPQKWNYACDYAIHSIIMQYINHWSSNSRQRNALKMPRNCLYSSKYDDMSAEQIYSLLPDNYKQVAMFGNGGGSASTNGSSNNSANDESSDNDNNNSSGSGGNKNQTPLDDHSKWYTRKAQKDASIKARTWSSRLLTAAIQANSKKAGALPGSLSRLIDNLTRPQKSWRQILMDYLQQEVNDFSWARPDNRFTEAEFGDIKMPSFSETEDVAKDIVCAIDLSGSMSDHDINMIYSEIVGAAQQFKLHANLLFWDVRTTELIPFEDVYDLLKIKEDSKKILQGFSGGTRVECVFEKLKKDAILHTLSVLIICTDGYFSLPKEKIAEGIPVIWCIVNDDEHATPSWGRIVRLDPTKAK